MRRGFTLIELLIVISILTILAGLLFPVFAAARERARQTTCFSNERQIGAALLMYAQDYDEQLPSGTLGWPGNGWAGQIFPFVKSADIYKCPDDDKHPHESDDGGPIDPGAVEISYALNCNAVGQSLAAFNASSLTVLAFEVNDAASNFAGPENSSPTGRGLPSDNCPKCAKPFGADYYATGDIGAVSPQLSTTIRSYHDPTSNYLAGDGHVKALRPEQVSAGQEAPSPDAPQSTTRGTAAGTESMMISPTDKAALTFSTR
ncbi:MAG: prepilin-type N-terminal cleavage/methylation domain [Chthonomonadaceae bacterium]|nr:prepilin-type N-terminal cleavage/methylation domain [Chthonomonadaceae bacterium]